MKTVRFENPCDECTLDCRKLESKGKRDAIFLVVTKAPNRKQILGNRHLSPAALKVFSGEMKALGFSADDFIFHASVMCEFDKNVKETMIAKERHVIEKACREHLLRTIEEVKPTVIIPLGVEAATAVVGRKVKITKIRGVPEYHREHDCIVLPMLDPDQVVMYPQNAGLFRSDAAVLAKLDDHNYDLNSVESEAAGNYKLVDDLQFLVDTEPTLIAFDTETEGTRWQDEDKRLLTLQFSTEEGSAYVLSWDHPDRPMPIRKRKKIVAQIRELLCHPDVRVVGHNLKYDAMWLWAKLGIRIRIAEDTLMMIATLDENLMSKDLNTLTKMYVPEMGGYDDTFNAKHDKSQMQNVPLTEIVSYGGGDTDAALRLFNILEKQITKDPKLYNNYRYVSMPGINAFATVERQGMMIDEDALDRLEETVARGQAEAFTSLTSRVPRSIRRLHAEKGCVFSRADYLRDILFDHEDGFKFKPVVYTKSTAKLPDPSMRKPSVSTKDHLPYFFDKDPFVMELAEYVKNDRMLGTNIRSFREKYMKDGKVYPIYSLWTAVTGRCLVGSSKVVTNHGTMSIDDIGEYFATRKNPANGGLKVLTHTNRLRNVYDFIENGERRTYTVTTAKGYTLTATDNHPLLTEEGFVELGKLDEGDTCYVYDFDYSVNDTERWASTGVEGYEVSTLGSVRYLGDKFHKPKTLNPTAKGEYGHSRVRLGGRDYAIHRLVAQAFIGPCPDGHEVCHLNGLPSDNRLSNLRYGTSAENSEHTITHGRSRRGSVHTDAKYSEDFIRTMRNMHFVGGKNFAEIGRELGVNRRYVRQICIGERRPEPKQVFQLDTIVSIEYSGIQTTYDISVEEDHSFVADNFVVHNSASRDPNGQNFPKRGEYAKAYRSIFVPPEGYVLLEADLSQAELRISGDMANDPVIIDIYNNDGDIHTSTAAMVMGVTLDQFMQLPSDDRKLARFKAKAVNFGFIYGMGWRKFVGYAKTQYGVEFTDKEAEAIRKGYFKLYPALEPWHRQMRQYAKDHGFVRSYSGRVRHLPMIDSPDDYIRSEAERQAINSPVQEFGSTLGVMAMSRIEQEVDQDYLRLMGFVHDALYAYVRLEHLEWGAKTLKHYMESNPLEEWFNRRMKVPIKSDVGFGPHGGKTYEMETLKLDEPYNFADLGEIDMEIPEQEIPPNNGRKPVEDYLSMYDLADDFNVA